MNETIVMFLFAAFLWTMVAFIYFRNDKDSKKEDEYKRGFWDGYHHNEQRERKRYEDDSSSIRRG